MKNFLIFLSILVVTLLAVSDLQQRMSELDNISRQSSITTETQNDYDHNSGSYNLKPNSDSLKTHK